MAAICSLTALEQCTVPVTANITFTNMLFSLMGIA